MMREGSLAERDLPSLMQSLYEERWSGLLTLTHAGIGKNVTVQDGRMVFASSSSKASSSPIARAPARTPCSAHRPVIR